MTNFEFLARNMTTPEFAKFTGVSLTTINDWRKREMLTGIGQPHPSHDGRWIYGRDDALSIHLAQTYVENGVRWKEALFFGYVVQGYLVGKHLYGERQAGYAGRFLLFYRVHGEELPGHILHDEIEMAMDAAFNRNGAAICQFVDLVWTQIGLPRKLLDGLTSLEKAD